jgi:aspartate/methionine/tyrosine aminotransferase
MEPGDALTEALRAHHPAAAATLSPLGQRVWFPRGVPAQAAEAAGCAVNATIGQITDGRGGALPLPQLEALAGPLPAKELFLYAAQGGRPDLRDAWADRLRPLGGRFSRPVVTCGLTHALSLCAELFAGPGTPVLLPYPAWGNYAFMFGVRQGAQVRRYPVLREDGGGLDLAALDAALQALPGPAVLVLNHPSNPIGYAPALEDAAAVVEVIRRAPHPLVVICDDAYAGMVWEPGLQVDSLFHALSALDPARVLAVKVDGATKELFFFGARIGFLTFGCEGPAARALEDKAMGLARASVSCAPSAPQAMILRALADPGLGAEQARLRGVIAGRYRALKAALAAHGVPFWPFNAAFFALVPVDGDPQAARRSLLAEGVGVVAVEPSDALRISYASLVEGDMDRLAAALAPRARRG